MKLNKNTDFKSKHNVSELLDVLSESDRIKNSIKEFSQNFVKSFILTGNELLKEIPSIDYQKYTIPELYIFSYKPNTFYYNRNNFKEYKPKYDLSKIELHEKLKDICENLDVPLYIVDWTKKEIHVAWNDEVIDKNYKDQAKYLGVHKNNKQYKKPIIKLVNDEFSIYGGYTININQDKRIVTIKNSISYSYDGYEPDTSSVRISTGGGGGYYQKNRKVRIYLNLYIIHEFSIDTNSYSSTEIDGDLLNHIKNQKRYEVIEDLKEII